MWGGAGAGDVLSEKRTMEWVFVIFGDLRTRLWMGRLPGTLQRRHPRRKNSQSKRRNTTRKKGKITSTYHR